MSFLRRFSLVPALVVAALSFACMTAPRLLAVGIEVGSATGRPGQTVTVEVSIVDVGELNVVALENKIAFTSAAAVAALPDRRPDCELARRIDKEFITTFTPPGCAAENCRFRGIVGRFDPSDPTTLDPVCLRNECVLYTCSVKIALDAQVGQYPLECVDPILSDREGRRISDPGCTSGAVTVLPPLPTPSPSPVSGGGGGGGGGGCQLDPAGEPASWLLLAAVAFMLAGMLLAHVRR